MSVATTLTSSTGDPPSLRKLIMEMKETWIVPVIGAPETHGFPVGR